MKKIFVLMVASTLSIGLFAQTGKDKKMDKMEHSGKMDKMDKMDHAGMGTMHKGMRDCVMMEDGKMMVMKGGKTMQMDKEMTLQNGTMVMSDGSVKMKNGKTAMLKNGDCVYMNGKMSKMDMKKDKMKM
jgi:hypothetical protein